MIVVVDNVTPHGVGCRDASAFGENALDVGNSDVLKRRGRAEEIDAASRQTSISCVTWRAVADAVARHEVAEIFDLAPLARKGALSQLPDHVVDLLDGRDRLDVVGEDFPRACRAQQQRREKMAAGSEFQRTRGLRKPPEVLDVVVVYGELCIGEG